MPSAIASSSPLSSSRLQVRVVFAQPDRRALAEQPAGEQRAGIDEPALRRLHGRAEVGLRPQHRVDAAGLKIEHDVVVRLVGPHVDARQELRQQVGLDRRDLDTDRLAFQGVAHRGELRQRGVLIGEAEIDAGQRHRRERASGDHRERRRPLAVRHREGDLRLAFRRDAHARHDRVELAGLESGDQAVPVLHDGGAGDLQPPADIRQQIRFIADDLAVGRRRVEQRIGAFRRDRDMSPVLGEGRGDAEGEAEEGGGEAG